MSADKKDKTPVENEQEQKEPAATEKRKLTREELLAGKTGQEDSKENLKDPRFKSPDELLLNLMANRPVKEKTEEPLDLKEAKKRLEKTFKEEVPHLHNNGKPEQPPQKLGPPNESPSQPPLIIERNNQSDDKETPIETFDLAYQKLKEKYDTDMAKWKEYDQSVNHWRDRVLQIVSHFKKELSSTKGLKSEVVHLRSEIKRRDDEIKKLKKHKRSHKTK